MSADPTAQAPRGAVRRRALRATVAGGAALTAVSVPAFLVGALSGRMSEDLGVAATGAVVTAFFAGAGLAAVPMGRVAERVGARRAMRGGVVIAAAALIAIAAGAASWWHVGVIGFLAGSSVGLVDTGAARSFADAVPSHRHGLAFGVKEACVPAASLLAGMSIPLLAEHVGWRAAFLAGAALAGLVWTLVPPDTGARVAAPPLGAATRGSAPLVVFAVGIALATSASLASATLLVPAFEDRGWSDTSAGVLLAVVSLISIGCRVLAGGVIDRRAASSARATALFMATGAVGAAVLAVASSGAVAVVAAGLVLGPGWGWSGLAFHAATRATPNAPAVAAGIVLTGLAAGGAVGPAAFGALAETFSYAVAWAFAASGFLLGSVAAVLASRRAAVPVARRGGGSH